MANVQLNKELPQTVIHNDSQSRSDEKKQILKNYPNRELDHLFFQTGTYDVLHYHQAEAKQILDLIFSLIQLCWHKFTSKAITVRTIPLHREEYEKNSNTKIRFLNNVLRIACRQLNF